MSSEQYFVSTSRAKNVEFQHVVAEARRNGQFDMAGWILEELARTPLELGESRGEYASLELKLRFVYIRPIAVQFAVHESSRKVFIRSFRYRS